MTFQWVTAVEFVDIGGVYFNGIIGATLARRSRFDAVGWLVLGCASALGGGLLRDTLLQAGRPVALTEPAYLIAALAGVATALVLAADRRHWGRLIVVVDALALGCWACTGTMKALDAGLDWLPSILLGLTTAVGGGMIRDICAGRVPAVLGGNTLYATAALAAAILIALCPAVYRPTFGLGSGIVVAGCLVLVARRRGWSLPRDPEDIRWRPRPRRRSAEGGEPGD